MKLFYSLLLFLVLCAAVSCKKVFFGEIDPYIKEFVLFAEYSYPTGANSPIITIDRNLSSPEIEIGDQLNISATINSNNRIELPIENVKFQDERGVYQVVDDITAEVFDELSNTWETDVENFLNYSKTKDLTIVLVLDVSSSLDSDVALVKKYAGNFIDLMLQDRDPGAVTQFGVVGFSDTVLLLPATTQTSVVKQFINNLIEDKNATRLYQAMNAGINIAEYAPETDGYFMITFTDGRNNSWGDSTEYSTPTKIENRLSSSSTNLFSYTIGLDGKSAGGVNSNALTVLASGLPSGGSASTIIESTADLQFIFEKIAKSIAAEYELVYDRNISRIDKPTPLRFRIKCQLF